MLIQSKLNPILISHLKDTIIMNKVPCLSLFCFQAEEEPRWDLKLVFQGIYTQIYSWKPLRPELTRIKITALLLILIINLRDITSNIYLTAFTIWNCNCPKFYEHVEQDFHNLTVPKHSDLDSPSVSHIAKKIVFTFITPLHTLYEVKLTEYEWPNFCPQYKKSVISNHKVYSSLNRNDTE